MFHPNDLEQSSKLFFQFLSKISIYLLDILGEEVVLQNMARRWWSLGWSQSAFEMRPVCMPKYFGIRDERWQATLIQKIR